MTMDRDLDRVLARYLEDGPTEIADRVVTNALETIDHTTQARPRLRLPRRLTMQHPLRLAAVPVTAVIVVAVAIGLLNRTSQPPVAATPSPGVATVSPSASASASPGPTFTQAPPAAGPPLIAYLHRDPRVGGTTLGDWHVWIVRPDGSDRRPLNSELSVEPTVLAWSSDGSRVYASVANWFGSLPGHDPGIYAIDVATGEATRVSACVTPCYRDWYPHVSPDGSTLLVVRGTGDANSDPLESYLVSIDLASGQETEIPGTRLDGRFRPCGPEDASCLGTWLRGPSFSPDGRRIAFARMEERAVDPDAGVVRGATFAWGDLVVMDADGSNPRTLDLGGLPASDPVWSPDGARILFSSYVEDYVAGPDGGPIDSMRTRRDIYTVAADGSDLRRLTDDGNCAGAGWTSDGRIRFIRFGREGAGDAPEVNPNFWIMDADGSDAEQLTSFGPGDGDWSTISLSYPAAVWRPEPAR